jgi:hypothetical protein
MTAMKVQSFSLQPFSAADPGPPVTITGDLGQRGQVLALRYELRGPLGELVIPTPAALPARRQGLWEATCFEFFLAAQEAPGYWEFNLSPAGHWNAYRFAAYREGMTEEGAITALPFSLQRRPDALLLSLELDLARLVWPGRPLRAGVTAVLQLAGGRMTYWDLTHPGPQPDFHRRDSFTIEL